MKRENKGSKSRQQMSSQDVSLSLLRPEKRQININFWQNFWPGIIKNLSSGRKKKKKPADSKQRKLLSFFLMPACGSVAFLHLWQWTTHCHIRPALGGGQIAILRQDEVSPELIRFPQSLWEKSERKGDNFSLTAATPAHTLTLTRRANRRRSPAKAVSACGPLRQSERVY